MRTRSFVLVAVALFAALVGGFLYVALGGGEDRRVGAILPSTASAKYALELDGANVGFLKSVSGCGVSAPVLLGEKKPENCPARSSTPPVRSVSATE